MLADLVYVGLVYLRRCLVCPLPTQHLQNSVSLSPRSSRRFVARAVSLLSRARASGRDGLLSKSLFFLTYSFESIRARNIRAASRLLLPTRRRSRRARLFCFRADRDQR